jgi:predicted nicotinamide N-methyase
VTYTFQVTPLIEADTVTVLESRSIISALGTTGLRTWEAALHLACYLKSVEGSKHIRGKRVLEIGAGTGVVSILAAKYLSPQSVLATDGSQDVVDALQDNIFLNGLQGSDKIDARILKWGRYLDEDEGGQEKTFDILLGADIVRRDSSVLMLRC